MYILGLSDMTDASLILKIQTNVPLGSPCGDLAVNHTSCQNTEGGFACICVTGFSLDNVTQKCEGKLS